VTTKQKLAANPYVAEFIDGRPGDIIKWGMSESGTLWCNIEVLPPGIKGAWNSDN
jgi:hypothetical protein